MFDFVLRNARIIDGTGAPAFSADIAVKGDRIAFVGKVSRASRARREFDLDGLTVAPGFIDLHTHADFALPLYPRASSMVSQGVTTLVVGNCGFSPFPLLSGSEELARSTAAFLDAGISWEWRDLTGFARLLSSLPLAPRVALQVGHGALRLATSGADERPARPGEIDTMTRLAAKAFEQGAVGLSSGLAYFPGRAADRHELVTLCMVAARFGRFYSTHIRDEGARLLDAVTEAIDVARAAKVALQLSHHKALGKRQWGSTVGSLRLLDKARQEGLDVLADQYPYTATSTGLISIVPRWATDGGVVALLERLSNRTTRGLIRTDIEKNVEREFDPSSISIALLPNGPERWEGRRLDEIARERCAEPAETALWLVEESGGRATMVSHAMCEEDVERVMCHPAVAIASDGWTLSEESGGRPHPRSYGTFARVLGHYSRKRSLFPLEEAVRKMTSLPAGRLGRSDLGALQSRAAADLVVFDAERIRDVATFAEPFARCHGVCHVMVRGRLVIEEGEDTGEPAGEVLLAR